jgi:hypothetical protein
MCAAAAAAAANVKTSLPPSAVDCSLTLKSIKPFYLIIFFLFSHEEYWR